MVPSPCSISAGGGDTVGEMEEKSNTGRKERMAILIKY